MSPVDLVTVEGPDVDGLVATMRRFFGQSTDPQHAHIRDVVDRATMARLAGDDVGTAAVIGFDLTVPGGATVSMDGVTIVVVSPVARRRGVLRALMNRLADDARDRGAAVLGLGATESSIYRRFGYGVASYSGTAEIETAHAALRHPFVDPGRLRVVDVDQALPVWREVEGRCTLVGSINRRDATWRRLATPPPGASGPILQVIVHEDAGGRVDGFANLTQELRWRDEVADGVTRVQEFCALTPDAHLSLWQHILGLDLMEHLEFHRYWLDDPIQHLLVDPRRLRCVPRDDLHLRVLDVPAVLAARRYSRDDGLVIEVRDEACPDIEGRYRLDGGLDGATAGRTTAAADLVVDAPSLGSVLLGDVNLVALQAAGLVQEERAGAVRRAGAMFTWQPRPLLTYMF